MTRTAKQVLDEARELLHTAEFGLEDMRSRPERARTGLRNAVVFGRNTTWALQNLKSLVPEFEDWYGRKQEEMRADPLMRYFHDMRTAIEKQASTSTYTRTVIHSLGPGDMRQLMKSPPPGAKAFFMGDQNGGSGWTIPQPDGTEEKYYVQVPPEMAMTSMHLPNAPKLEGQNNPRADELVDAYLARIRKIVEEARERFGAG